MAFGQGFTIQQIENAPIALPVDFFPAEDPYEGIVKPAIKKFAPAFGELIQIHELPQDYRKAQLTGEVDFTAINQLATKNKKAPKLKVIEKIKPAGEPEQFHIYLKKGTKVRDLKFNYTKTIYRDIQVKAVRVYPSAPVFKIMDKKDHPRYEAKAEDVIFINETIDLDIRPKKYEVITKNKKNKAYDKEEKLEHALSINSESWDSSYFAVLTKNITTQDASTLKLNYKLYHLWDFPVNLGVLLSYENGSWDTDWDWNSIYWGLGLKVPWHLTSWVTLEAQLTWQNSLFFSLAGKENAYKLSNNHIAISVEIDFKTGFGTYFLDALYKKIYWSTDEQNILVPANKRDSSAIGFGVGIKFKSIINL